MVRVENNKLIIEFETISPNETLVNWHSAIRDAVCHFDFDNFHAREATFFLMEIMESITPSYDQFTRAITNEGETIVLPESMQPKQREFLRDAIFVLEHPTATPINDNPIYKAIQAIKPK